LQEQTRFSDALEHYSEMLSMRAIVGWKGRVVVKESFARREVEANDYYKLDVLRLKAVKSLKEYAT
jgi:hypothetical protein